MSIGPIDIAEAKLLTADFSREIGAATVTQTAWSCEVLSGTDPDPSSCLLGSPVVASPLAQHVVGCMRDGVRYSIRCVATDSNGLKHTAVCTLTAVRLRQ